MSYAINASYTMNTGGQGVTGVALDNIGHAYFCWFDASGNGSVEVIDVPGMTLHTTVTVGSLPYGLVCDNAGHLFVSDGSSIGTVSVVDTTSFAVTSTISVGSRPRRIAYDGAGHVFVANFTDGTVSVIDTTSMSVTNTLTVGSSPWGVACDGNGHAFVANSGSGTVSVIDIATMTVEAATITVGANPTNVASGSASHVFVTNGGSGTVSVIDTGQVTPTVSTVTLGGSPDGIAYDGAGHVFVGNTNLSGDPISIIDTATMTVEAGTISTNGGGGSGGTSIVSDRGGHVYTDMTNGGGAGIGVINVQSAPAAPTLLGPTAGEYVDTANPLVFQATYNSTDSQTQSAYALRIKQSSAPQYSYWNAASASLQTTIVWNTASTLPGATFTSTISSGALSDGNTYNWSMASQESAASLQGGFAADATFNAQADPTATINAPSGTVTTSSVLALWTTSPAPGASQTGYRLVLYTAAQASIGGFTPGVSPSTWDSGSVTSTQQSAAINYSLLTATTYKIYLQVTETGGEVSSWVSSVFTASFDAPATPTLSAAQSTDSVTGLPLIRLSVQGHDNVLSTDDASFETGVGTWVAGTNWTRTRDTVNVLDGLGSLKCVRANTTPGNGYAVTGQYTVQPSTLYTCMASIYADSTSAGKQYAVTVQESPSGVRTSATVTLGAAGTWTRASVQVTTGATTTAATLRMSDDPQTTPAAAQTVWVDEAGIFPGNISTWFRGGLAGSATFAILRDDGVYVRGASPANPGSFANGLQASSVVDAEVVPTVAHTYVAVVQAVLGSVTVITSASSNTTAPVAVPGALGFWEFDPLDLTTAVAAQMSAYNPQITEQAAAHLVMGQATPNIIASVMGGVDGQATFETFDSPTYKGLTDLLTSQRTIFISDPYGDNQGVTYVRFGPATGATSGGNGLKTKSANLLSSAASSPHHTVEITWIAQPRPAV